MSAIDVALGRYDKLSEEETAFYSRAYTMHSSLQRLDILDSSTASSPTSASSRSSSASPRCTTTHKSLEIKNEERYRELILYVVGADSTGEGATVPEAMEKFDPLRQFLTARNREGGLHPVRSLRIFLIGPNVLQPGIGKGDEIASHTHNSSTTKNQEDECEMRLHFVREELTSEVLERLEAQWGRGPQVCFLFDAGIWGYDSWIPTLAILRDCPLVITSYSLDEAEDDEDAIVEGLSGKCEEASGDGEEHYGVDVTWLWQPEGNPFGSRLFRESDYGGTCERTKLADNRVWQCIYVTGDRRVLGEQQQEQKP